MKRFFIEPQQTGTTPHRARGVEQRVVEGGDGVGSVLVSTALQHQHVRQRDRHQALLDNQLVHHAAQARLQERGRHRPQLLCHLQNRRRPPPGHVRAADHQRDEQALDHGQPRPQRAHVHVPTSNNRNMHALISRMSEQECVCESG